MIFSRDRILTTHVGSLPRNETLSDLLVEQEDGKPLDPKVLDRRDGQGGPSRRAEADGSRHRHRQRRRAAADRLPDLCAAAHVGFCGRIEAPPRPRIRGIPRADELPDAAVSQSAEEPARRAGGAGRDQISRSQADHRGDRRLQPHRRRAACLFGAVHDRGLARHHFDHDAQRLLSVARCVSRRHRPRDGQRVPGDQQSQASCCKSTHRTSPWIAP